MLGAHNFLFPTQEGSTLWVLPKPFVLHMVLLCVNHQSTYSKDQANNSEEWGTTVAFFTSEETEAHQAHIADKWQGKGLVSESGLSRAQESGCVGCSSRTKDRGLGGGSSGSPFCLYPGS